MPFFYVNKDNNVVTCPINSSQKLFYFHQKWVTLEYLLRDYHFIKEDSLEQGGSKDISILTAQSHTYDDPNQLVPALILMKNAHDPKQKEVEQDSMASAPTTIDALKRQGITVIDPKDFDDNHTIEKNKYDNYFGFAPGFAKFYREAVDNAQGPIQFVYDEKVDFLNEANNKYGKSDLRKKKFHAMSKTMTEKINEERNKFGDKANNLTYQNERFQDFIARENEKINTLNNNIKKIKTNIENQIKNNGMGGDVKRAVDADRTIQENKEKIKEHKINILNYNEKIKTNQGLIEKYRKNQENLPHKGVELVSPNSYKNSEKDYNDLKTNQRVNFVKNKNKMVDNDENENPNKKEVEYDPEPRGPAPENNNSPTKEKNNNKKEYFHITPSQIHKEYVANGGRFFKHYRLFGKGLPNVKEYINVLQKSSRENKDKGKNNTASTKTLEWIFNKNELTTQMLIEKYHQNRGSARHLGKKDKKKTPQEIVDFLQKRSKKNKAKGKYDTASTKTLKWAIIFQDAFKLRDDDNVHNNSNNYNYSKGM